jgi:glycosyltransferase involved in cell wall biosynthesis
MNNKKICLIYNYAQHYRKDIFMLLDKELKCDFVFGDKLGDIKKLDYTLLKHFKKEVKNIVIKYPVYYQKGVLPLLREDYTHYIMLGETICVSTWLILIFNKFFYHKKIYLWTHGWYGKESKLRIFLKKVFFKLVDGTFLYGNYAKNLMIENGLDAKKMHVIYNSLAYDEQLKIRRKLDAEISYPNIYHKQFGNTDSVLIFLGRLTKRKQLHLAIEAINRLNNEENIPVNLVLIGKGEAEAELKVLVAKYNLSDKVWFYGDCYDEEINGRLLYDADICISPGDVGLTAIHVFTFGCPVITHQQFQTQGPEFEIVEPEISGMFFEKNSIEDLVSKTKYFLAYEKDKRETIRQACYRQVDEKYNPHKQVETIKSVLENEQT